VNAGDADIPEQFRIRRDKRARLSAEGRDPYPVAKSGAPTPWRQVRAAHPDLPADSTTGDIVGVAGPGGIRA
jgi:lysyl-tRNA synthetase class 2